MIGLVAKWHCEKRFQVPGEQWAQMDCKLDGYAPVQYGVGAHVKEQGLGTFGYVIRFKLKDKGLIDAVELVKVQHTSAKGFTMRVDLQAGELVEAHPLKRQDNMTYSFHYLQHKANVLTGYVERD